MNPTTSNSIEPISLSDPEFEKYGILHSDHLSSIDFNSSHSDSEHTHPAATTSTSEPLASSSTDEDTLLPDGYVPSKFDVICGRGQGSQRWVGNRRFRYIVQMHLKRYVNAPSKSDKSQVVNSIVQALKEADGKFVKQPTAFGKWCVLSDRQARDKIAHAIRDAAAVQEAERKGPSSKPEARKAIVQGRHSNISTTNNAASRSSRRGKKKG